MGLAYIAITDHSRRLAFTHGLDENRLLAQIERIDAFNELRKGIEVLKGVEVDILENGNLDLPDAALARLDLVIGAIHSGFGLSRDEQTARILRAMDHPHFSILAHPTDRLLLERDGYEVDMQRVIRAAKARGCFLELNAQPDRLDLSDVHCRMAKSKGVMVSVNTDAHWVDSERECGKGIWTAPSLTFRAQSVLSPGFHVVGDELLIRPFVIALVLRVADALLSDLKGPHPPPIDETASFPKLNKDRAGPDTPVSCRQPQGALSSGPRRRWREKCQLRIRHSAASRLMGRPMRTT